MKLGCNWITKFRKYLLYEFWITMCKLLISSCILFTK